MASAFRDWFVMLATTRMTKSFKMVLLRVLLDNDSVFSGMPIPELAEVPDLDDRHVVLRRDRSRVGDLVVLRGAHLLGPQCCHCNRFAVERHELDFVSLALVMHQHDRPDVAGCETVFREIARQHRYVEFIDHVRLAPDANGLEITEVAAAVQDSSDLDAIRRGTKKDHVHTD
jgi:hypothetical protein